MQCGLAPNQVDVGAIPTRLATQCQISSMVEQGFYKAQVVGSVPTSGTNLMRISTLASTAGFEPVTLTRLVRFQYPLPHIPTSSNDKTSP